MKLRDPFSLKKLTTSQGPCVTAGEVAEPTQGLTSEAPAQSREVALLEPWGGLPGAALSLIEPSSPARCLPLSPPHRRFHSWNEPSLPLPPRTTAPRPKCSGDTNTHAGRHPRPHPSPSALRGPATHSPLIHPSTAPALRTANSAGNRKHVIDARGVPRSRGWGSAAPTIQRPRDAAALWSITAQGFPHAP